MGSWLGTGIAEKYRRGEKKRGAKNYGCFMEKMDNSRYPETVVAKDCMPKTGRAGNNICSLEGRHGVAN
jgi:hypothetical protein